MWKRFRDRRATCSEEGFTFLEVLVTLAILSISFVAILSAIVTLISSTDQQKTLAKGENAVRTLGEFVKAAQYVPCSAVTLSSYQDDIQQALDAEQDGTGPKTGFSDFSPTIVPPVQSWNGDSPATFVSCAAADNGAQRITLRVTGTSLGRDFTQTLTIIKRKP